MAKLVTIQKREKLNEIHSLDDKGPGGANHFYAIDGRTAGGLIHNIQFQEGPRNCEKSIHGVIDSDLLEIVRHRLQCFQAGPFASRENAVALTHIEEALMWMNRRVEDRIERNVLGSYDK